MKGEVSTQQQGIFPLTIICIGGIFFGGKWSFLSGTFSAKEVPKPIPLSVAIFTISFLVIRRDLKNHHVANYGGGKTSLSRYAGLLASILSRAENLSHRCKSVPTGTLSANILTTSKHFLQTF